MLQCCGLNYSQLHTPTDTAVRLSEASRQCLACDLDTVYTMCHKLVQQSLLNGTKLAVKHRNVRPPIFNDSRRNLQSAKRTHNHERCKNFLAR